MSTQADQIICGKMVRNFHDAAEIHSYEALNVGVWLNMVSVLTLLPIPVEHATILEIFDDLKKFEELSKMLQKENSSLADVRSGCDWLRGKFPITDPKLKPDFCNEHHQVFESGVTKVQGNKEAQLTQEGKTALEPFLRGVVEINEEIDEADESLQGAPKRARVAPIAIRSNCWQYFHHSRSLCCPQQLGGT